MADNKINIPGGMGGLMRYDDEYDSKIMLKPGHVIVFVVAVIVLVIGLNLFWPVSG